MQPRQCILPFLVFVWSCVCLSAFSRPVPSGDATVPGEVTTPYPTFQNLAIEWAIQGDDNLNGDVTVQYRRVGETAWHKAMPLRRIPAGHFKETRPNSPPRPEWSWESRQSGSILDLRPGTEYEIALSLNDPDGGSAERTVRVATRAIPQAMPGARVKHVTPENFAAEAVKAEPGDLFLLAPGEYNYFAATRDGSPGKPIVFRADPDGRWGVNKGASLFDGISLQKRKFVYLEGLWSRDTIDLFNAEECVIRRCHIHAISGIVASFQGRMWGEHFVDRLNPPATPDLWVTRELPPGATPRPFAKNCLITDNVIVGMTEWTSDAFGVAGKNMGEGIQITGPGNVICYNKVTGFRDCISTFEDEVAVNQVCIDIYNNDLYNGPDDGIEADFCMDNCRIMRNRITNCFNGLSSQPSLGGPTYFIRNVMYNLISTPYKFMRQSTGNVVLHNTIVKTGDGVNCSDTYYSEFLNNIGIGGGELESFGSRYRNGRGLAVNIRSEDPTCTIDYNGYGTTGFPFSGIIAGKPFDSLENLRTATSEKHGVQVGLDIFQTPVVMPVPALKEWYPPNLELRGGSAAMDAGIVIPNINDEYTGQAPDLGAYEVGRELPVYGPRPEGVDN